MSKHVVESEEEFDRRFEDFFNRPDIDGWEVRKAMNDLHADDLVPEPKIIIAALKACRRINDYALAVRYLEAVKVLFLNFYVCTYKKLFFLLGQSWT